MKLLLGARGIQVRGRSSALQVNRWHFVKSHLQHLSVLLGLRSLSLLRVDVEET